MTESNIPESNPGPPPAYNPEEKPGGLAIASMIIGICSVIICCFNLNLILGIVAVIMGFVERYNIKEGNSNQGGKNYALTGIITGFIGIGLWFLFIIFGFGAVILSVLMEETGWISKACLDGKPIDPDNPVRLPGQSALAKKNRYLKEGVELEPGILPALEKWSAALGVEVPEPIIRENDNR